MTDHLAPKSEEIQMACEKLANGDSVLAKALEQAGIVKWRAAPADCESLCRIIVFQLLSTKAADKIWSHVLAEVGTPVTTANLLSRSQESLRKCGLSNAKCRSLHAVAQHLQMQPDFFYELQRLNDHDALLALQQIKGVGPWSAKIFLMFNCGRLDLFPENDVGLLQAWQLLSGEKERRNCGEFAQLALRWRPYRAVAAHMLWQWFNLYRDGGIKI